MVVQRPCCHFAAGSPWDKSLNLLVHCITLHICKMGIRMVENTEEVVERARHAAACPVRPAMPDP